MVASMLSIFVPASIPRGAPMLPVLVFPLLSIFASFVSWAPRTLSLGFLSISSSIPILYGRSSIPSGLSLVPIGPGHQFKHLSSLLELHQGDPHSRESGMNFAL